MSIYGNGFMREQEPVVTMEMFMDFFTESTIQMELMFERANIIQTLREENTELAIPISIDFSKSSDSEKVKKSVIEWAKEVFKNFVKAVKDLFNKVAESIHKLYLNTNFIDKIVSRYKDTVTYENLEKIKEKGWPGLPTSYPLINKYPDVRDSALYRYGDSDDSSLNVLIDHDSVILPIGTAQTLDEAKEAYSKFSEKLEKLEKSTKHDDSDTSISFSNEFKAKLTDNYDLVFYGCFGTTLEDKNHYMPAKNQFMFTKDFAEKGEAKIKEIRDGYKFIINKHEITRDIELSNMKSFRPKGSNHISDEDVNQINILYYKARYKYAGAIVKRLSKIIKSIITIIKQEHIIAIRTYSKLAKDITHYLGHIKGNKEENQEEK